jgi:hypothetical protein
MDMKKILAFIMIASMTSGCFVSPDKRFVEASKSTFEVVAPEYRAYFNADESLDKEQKQDREDLLRAWKRRLDEASK